MCLIFKKVLHRCCFTIFFSVHQAFCSFETVLLLIVREISLFRRESGRFIWSIYCVFFVLVREENFRVKFFVPLFFAIDPWFIFSLFFIGFFVFIFIASILLFIYIFFSVSCFLNLSPFECGFESVGSVRLTFSIHFFIILIVFALFDLEVVFLLGFLVGGSLWIFIVLIFIIYGTYYLEVFLGSLYWINYSFSLNLEYFFCKIEVIEFLSYYKFNIFDSCSEDPLTYNLIFI